MLISLAALVFCVVCWYDKDLPGTKPARHFIDNSEEYSADGCWVRRNGYWRPLRRCNVVRFQNSEQ